MMCQAHVARLKKTKSHIMRSLSKRIAGDSASSIVCEKASSPQDKRIYNNKHNTQVLDALRCSNSSEILRTRVSVLLNAAPQSLVKVFSRNQRTRRCGLLLVQRHAFKTSVAAAQSSMCDCKVAQPRIDFDGDMYAKAKLWFAYFELQYWEGGDLGFSQERAVERLGSERASRVHGGGFLSGRSREDEVMVLCENLACSWLDPCCHCLKFCLEMDIA